VEVLLLNSPTGGPAGISYRDLAPEFRMEILLRTLLWEVLLGRPYGGHALNSPMADPACLSVTVSILG
jgi:hypothetical protein